MLEKILAVSLPLLLSWNALAASDTITGTYSGNNRFAMFEKLKNGDVRFYISGIQIGSRYSCNVGDNAVSILAMNGTTGGFSDTTNTFSVEFEKKSVRIIVAKSSCLIDGVYKKTAGKEAVNWDLDAGD
jgi:hypothetical protein